MVPALPGSPDVVILTSFGEIGQDAWRQRPAERLGRRHTVEGIAKYTR